MKSWKIRGRNIESWKRRKYERHRVNLKVGVDADAPSPVKGRILLTHDISPAGAFVVTEEPLNIGTRVFLRILLPSGARSIVLGVVWRSVAFGMAVRFEQLCSDIMKEFGGSSGSKKASLPVNFFSGA